MRRNRKYWLRRCVPAAILVALINGHGWAATHDQGLSGSVDDRSWLREGTVTSRGDVVTYDFDGTNQTFTVERDPAAYFGADPRKVIVNNAGGTLYLTGTNSTPNDFMGGRALAIEDGGNVTINSDLNLSASGDYVASGISVSRGGSGEGIETHLVINGNVTMRKNDPSNPWAGVTNNIHGNYDSYPSFGASNYTGARWAPQAIRLAEQDGSTITINGDLDIAWKGTGIATDAYNTRLNPYDEDIITTNGNVRVETPVSNTETYYSLANYGGTINLNATKDQAETHDVTLLGNIITIRNPGGTNGGDPYFYQSGRTNIGLTTGKSMWEGVIDNAGKSRAGEVNVWLENGAVWDHHSRSVTDGMQVANMPNPSKDHYGKYNAVSYVTRLTGSTAKETAGWIYQRDKAALEIATFSGSMNVVYPHSGNGTEPSQYASGDMTIQNAEPGALITLLTDNSGINMTNQDQKTKVLNALAQKLIYSAYVSGERNLSGKAQIASGLTSSAFSLYTGDIQFDSAAGRGGVSNGKDVVSPALDFTETLTGRAGTVYDGYQDGTKYDFGKDHDIQIKPETGAALDAQADFTVVSDGGTLELTGGNRTTSLPAAVRVTGGHTVALYAGTVRASLEDNGDAGPLVSGVSLGTLDSSKGTLNVNGNLAVHVKGNGTVMGIYAIQGSTLDVSGNVTMKGAEGTAGVSSTDNPTGPQAHYHVNGIYAGSGNSQVTVHGDVDLLVKGTGIRADSGADISVLGGGSVEIAENNSTDQYALVSGAATVRMNVTGTDGSISAGRKDTVVKGNLGLLNNSEGIGPDSGGRQAAIYLGLATDKSSLTGVVLNEYREQGIGNADANLFLSNGGIWNNEAYGMVKDGFTGSRVKVTGGADMDHAGCIMQRDTRPLIIDSYSGSLNLVYAHTGDGTSYGRDYAAGDTKILDAADGSQITISTDSSGIDTEDKAAVEKTVSALTNKLWYMKPAEKKLKAKVRVASGLTQSSKGLYLGDMWFAGEKDNQPDNPANLDNYGQGQYAPGSLHRIHGNQIETGDYETPLMKGVRQSITATALSWRSMAGDTFGRTKLIRFAEEADGVWAKAYGGKYVYDSGHADLRNSYSAAQVGFEKQNGSWHTGIAVDYRDGESTYKGNGHGDDTTYAVSVYGIKEFGNGTYLDLAAKAGHLENEFEVYNEIDQRLKGTYQTTGWSATAQYGKRFGTSQGYVEPQAQLTFARLEGKGFDAASPSLGKLQVNQDTIDSIVGSLGVEAGVETGKGTVFGRLGLAHEFAGGIDGTYSAADGAPKTTSFDTKDTWIDMTLGGRWNLSKTAQVYADFTNSLTGDYRNHWKVNGGLKFNFSTAPINPAKETEWKVMESAESYRNMPMKKQTEAAAGTPAPSAKATSVAVPSSEAAATTSLPATSERVSSAASKPVHRGGKATQAKTMTDVAVEDTGYAEVGLDETGYGLAPIVVTATRTEKSLADAHADISVVTRKEMEQMHMNTVEEALRTAPGVQFLNYGQNGMNGNLSGIRLNGSKDIIILVDGVRVTDFQDVGSSGYVYSFLLNNMDNIERIEVLRGAAGTVYGSGAKGGVINIITRKINNASAVVDAARGSFGKQVYHVNTQGRKGKFSYNAYYNADKRGDYQDGEGRRWPGHTDTKSDGVKLAYDLTPDHTVTFQYDWMDSKYNGQDLIYIGPYNGRYKSRMWSLTDDWKVDDHWRNKLTYRNNRLETRYGKPLGEGNSQGTVSAPYSVSSDMNYDFLSNQVEFTDACNTLVFGVDYSKARSLDGQHPMGFDEDGDAIYGDRSMKNHSYYIQDDWKLSPAITLSGGLRHDKPNGDGSSPNMDSHTSKSYKLSFDLTKKDTFYAGRSDFYILPSLYQLYDEKYGNADLCPAEGRTTTIGYARKFGEKDLLTVNWFETESERSIGYSSSGQYQNFRNGISRGWNAQYTKQINDNWNFRFGWAHLFANEGAGDTFSLGYYPKDMATFLIGYNKDKFGAAVDGFYFIRRTNPVNSDVRGWPSNKYGVYNLSMDYAPTKQMKFYLKVDNIFDKLWAEHTDVIWNGVPGSWYSQPGRTITLGVQYKF